MEWLHKHSVCATFFTVEESPHDWTGNNSTTTPLSSRVLKTELK